MMVNVEFVRGGTPWDHDRWEMFTISTQHCSARHLWGLPWAAFRGWWYWNGRRLMPRWLKQILTALRVAKTDPPHYDTPGEGED